MEQCNLCDTDLGPVITESAHWKLVLNKNQSLLGKCFLVLRRHLEVYSKVVDWQIEEGGVSLGLQDPQRRLDAGERIRRVGVYHRPIGWPSA